MKATNEELTKSIYIATHKKVSALLADHNALKAKNDKDPAVGGRYKLSAAIAQLTAVLEAFSKSGIEIPAAAAEVPVVNKEGTEEAPVKNDAEEEAVDKEGGGEDEAEEGAGEPEKTEEKGEGAGEGAGGAAAPVPSMDPGKYESDDFSYEGWEAVPAIFLKQATVNPYWGDLVKGHIINYEFA